MFVEEATPTAIGTFQGGITVPAMDLIKVLTSELLKSKVLKLHCLKHKAYLQKNCASKKIKSGMKYPSFEKKKVVDDLPKNQQDFEVAVVLEISITSKVGESSSTTFPPSSLDPMVMEDLLEVEKLIGYKPEAEVEGHFTHCI